MLAVRHRAPEPRGTSPGYGYLIQLVAAQLRGSKKRTQRAALGTTANWAFCKLRGLLIGDFVGSKPQHGTAWAEHHRRHDDGLGSSLWVGGSTRLFWLQAIELADVIGRGKWAIECLDDDHAATAALARWRFVVGGGRVRVIAVGVRGSWRLRRCHIRHRAGGNLDLGQGPHVFCMGGTYSPGSTDRMTSAFTRQ
jgi:hypothetical protein